MDWYHSKPHHVGYGLELENAFKVKEDAVTLIRKFQERKWGRNEKFSTYYMDKVMLGNKLRLSEPDLISYVIEGFDKSSLQTMARMTGFRSLSSLLTKMNKFPVWKGSVQLPQLRKLHLVYLLRLHLGWFVAISAIVQAIQR